jgi:hypothetical protein
MVSITDDGLVFGAGSVLAKQTIDASGRRLLAVDGNEERILALLTAAYGRPIDPAVIDHIRRASLAYNRGETCLALIHLAHTGLPRLDDEKTCSYRLFVAETVLDAGADLGDVVVPCDIDECAHTALKAAYDRGEPRIPTGNGRERPMDR